MKHMRKQANTYTSHQKQAIAESDRQSLQMMELSDTNHKIKMFSMFKNKRGYSKSTIY